MMAVGELWRDTRRALAVRHVLLEAMPDGRRRQLIVIPWLAILVFAATGFIEVFGFVIALSVLRFYFQVWSWGGRLERRSDLELLAISREALVLADLLHWLPHAAGAALALVGSVLLQAAITARPAWSAMALLALGCLPFVALVVGYWGHLERRLPGGANRLTYALASGFATSFSLLAIWMLFGTLTWSEVGVSDLVVGTTFLSAVILPHLAPVQELAAARAQVTVREIQTSALVAQCAVLSATAAVVTYFKLRVSFSGLAGGLAGVAVGIQIVGMLVLVARSIRILPLIDLGLAPKQATGERAGISSRPPLVGHGLVRAAIAMARCAGQGGLLAVALGVGGAFVLGIFVGVVQSILVLDRSVLASVMGAALAAGAIFSLMPYPLGVASSRRLYLLGVDFERQAKHNIRWGLVAGALPVLLGATWWHLVLGSDPYLVLRGTGLVATVAILRATGVLVRRGTMRISLPARGDLLLLAAIAMAGLSAGLAALGVLVTTIAALQLAWRRYVDPGHHARWERYAAEDA